jgi:hypothetical protein
VCSEGNRRGASVNFEIESSESLLIHFVDPAVESFTLVKNRTTYHQGSSPTRIFATVASLAKGIEMLAYTLTLLLAEV